MSAQEAAVRFFGARPIEANRAIDLYGATIPKGSADIEGAKRVADQTNTHAFVVDMGSALFIGFSRKPFEAEAFLKPQGDVKRLGDRNTYNRGPLYGGRWVCAGDSCMKKDPHGS